MRLVSEEESACPFGLRAGLLGVYKDVLLGDEKLRT